MYKDTETETYVDPISGMVTTIERPKPKTIEKKQDEQPITKPLETRSSSDLSSRLAAVMAEKAKRPDASPRQQSSNSIVDKKDEIALGNAPILAEKTQENAVLVDTDEVISRNTREISNAATVEDVIPNVSDDTSKPDAIIQQDTPVAVETDSEKMTTDASIIELDTVETTKDKPEQDTNTNQDDTSLEPTSSSSNNKQDTILEQREHQLFQAMENIAKLHDQIHQLQEDAERNEISLKSKIAQLETKQIEIGDQSPAQLQKSMKRLESTVEDLKKQLTSKDEKIHGLLQEGEKLSKVELRHSTTIKKLRSEKTEADKTIVDLTKKLEKVNADLLQASQKGTKQTETEKRLQESVKLLSDLTEQQTKHINKLESEKLASQKKHTDTEVALKKALDATEEERAKAKLDAEQESAAALEKEIKANDRLHKELTKIKESAESLETRLRKEVRELQIALQTVEEHAGAREDGLRQEVADLQSRLQQSDYKMDDMSTSVDEATAPLLRQIEQLQTQHAMAIRNRDQAEQRFVLYLRTSTP